MTISPAFLAEFDDQVCLAREELALAAQSGDEAAEAVAAARLADLEEVAGRATDASLLATPCWP